MKYYLLQILFLFFFISASAQQVIRVNAAQKIKSVPPERIGINLNYLTDDKENTPNALKELGVKFLRFPGGEKSDNYIWGQRPFTNANHTLALTGNCHWPNNDSRFVQPDYKTLKPGTLDFDEFMLLASNINAQPLIVVNADGHRNNGSTCGGVPLKDSLLTVAREWVRYANVVKQYQIKYWMIGNESFKSAAYAGKVRPEQYRDDVIDFARTMKAIDPTIKIVVNGDTDKWWQVLLSDSVATSYIDYLGVSAYPLYNWKLGYKTYLQGNNGLTNAVQVAHKAIDKYVTNPQDRERIRIMATEANALDFGEAGWPNTNDLGHSLTLFDILGQHLLAPKVDYTFFWNTQWVDNKPNTQGFNAITTSGKLLPNGQVLSLWNNFLLDSLVASTSTNKVVSYATTDQNHLTVFLLNKDALSHQVDLEISNFDNHGDLQRFIYKGKSLTDTIPEFVPADSIMANENSNAYRYKVPVLPYSITVLRL